MSATMITRYTRPEAVAIWSQDTKYKIWFEIEAHAAESGIPLPMSADMVVTFEDAGAVVELDTGWIVWPSGVRCVPVCDGPTVKDIVEAKTVA